MRLQVLDSVGPQSLGPTSLDLWILLKKKSKSLSIPFNPLRLRLTSFNWSSFNTTPTNFQFSRMEHKRQTNYYLNMYQTTDMAHENCFAEAEKMVTDCIGTLSEHVQCKHTVLVVSGERRCHVLLTLYWSTNTTTHDSLKRKPHIAMACRNYRRPRGHYFFASLFHESFTLWLDETTIPAGALGLALTVHHHLWVAPAPRQRTLA